MVVDGDPPTKKRRTVDAPTTLDAIAQSNATLQYFTNARQKRGMHNGVGQQSPNGIQTVGASSRARHLSTNGTSPSPPNTPSLSSRRLRHATASASSNALSTPAVAPIQMQQRGSSATSSQRPEPPSLGQYEVPIPTPAPSESGRKSMRVVTIPRPATQPAGLPSPAPSDENNTESPMLAESQLQQMRSRASLGHARQPADSWMAPTTQTSVSASPVVMNLPSTVPVVRGHTPIASHDAQRSSSMRAQLPPDMTANVMQPNSQPLPTPPVVPSNHPRPKQLQASRIDVNVLLQKLASIQNSPKHTLSRTECFRLVLLREAVVKQDWFYQMTSQLFCARSADPGRLPQSIVNLHPRCWDYLSILLRPNTEISPPALQFFENFPEPITLIYADQAGARDIYEMRLRAIKSFLHRLPAQWESLVARCKELQVPPLVQDLVENLGVGSCVLQTTIFRAIMRMVYGPNQTALTTAVAKIHQLDQAAWYQNPYKRTALEESDAYAKLRSIWDRWVEGRNQGRDAIEFSVHADVLAFFARTPRNLSPSPSAQPRNPQPLQSPNQRQQASHRQQLLNRLAQAENHAHLGRHSPASAQATTPLILQQQQQYHAGLMNFAAGGQSINARLAYGRSRLLYPRPQDGYRAQPTQPDPTRSALHQAHLRSPVLTSAKLNSETIRLYRHVIGFSLPPTTLDKSSPWQTVPFEVTAPIAERLARLTTSSPNIVSEQSLMLRLRCAVLPAAGFVSENAWVIAANYWPEEVCFECNGVKLEPRRKLHHGRYLPTDLTTLVNTGENTLRISCSSKKAGKRGGYAVAVEVIGFMSHESIVEQLSRVTAEQSLTTIKNSLSEQDDGDDDLAVTSSTMTIKLTDPYSGCKMLDTPVRGATCLHNDCFDLETFLSMCKRPAPDSPTVVDCWRCPLCRGDVRPQTLLVDGFMVQVREELAKNNALDTRGIIVEANGLWKPKLEEATGVRSSSLDREGSNSMPPPPSIPKAAASPPPTVIELE